MEKYLVPELTGQGELSDQWRRFKNEFTQFLTVTDKAGSSKHIFFLELLDRGSMAVTCMKCCRSMMKKIGRVGLWSGENWLWRAPEGPANMWSEIRSTWH